MPLMLSPNAVVVRCDITSKLGLIPKSLLEITSFPRVDVFP